MTGAIVATALFVHGHTPLDQLDTYDDDDLVPLSETLGIPPLKIGHPEYRGNCSEPVATGAGACPPPLQRSQVARPLELRLPKY
jgi:hypothetical protein